MIALLKCGTGLPFNRLEGLQGNLGIPLPAYEELIRQAAQGDVVYNDDTTVKIRVLPGRTR